MIAQEATIAIINRVIFHGGKSVNLTADEENAILTLPPNESSAALRALFSSEQNSITRSRVFYALMSLRGFDQVQFLIDVFNDENTGWQCAICDYLSQYQDKRAVAKLCDILLHHSDADVRFIAAEGLGKIGDETAIDVLKYAKKHDKGKDYEGFRVSQAARESLVKLQGNKKQTKI